MLSLIDNKYIQGVCGAIAGSLATIFVFRNRLAKIEEEHKAFRRETREMFNEIRQDIKLLLSRRRNDNGYISRIMQGMDD